MNRVLSARWLVRLWIAGFLASGLSAQGIGRYAFAVSTVWGFNSGWQTEILVFNLFAASMLVVIARHAPQLEHCLVLPLTLLPLALGANHAFAALTGNGSVTGNWMGTVSNGMAFAFGVAVLLSARSKSRSR